MAHDFLVTALSNGARDVRLCIVEYLALIINVIHGGKGDDVMDQDTDGYPLSIKQIQLGAICLQLSLLDTRYTERLVVVRICHLIDGRRFAIIIECDHV